MTQVLRGNRDCDQTVHDFLVSAPAAVRRVLDVEFVLEPARPRLVVGRPVQDAVEVVLKAVLRCEPLLDLAGD